MRSPTDAPANPRTRQLKRLADMLHKEIGVKPSASKVLMIERRLQHRIQALGYADADAYLAYLFQEGGLEDERPALYDAVTTTKTAFFREADHYALLTSHIVPHRRRAGRATFKLWSAAAASGAEAWSAAMVLAALPAGQALRWAVLGTDINTRMLALARRAIYSAAEVEAVPARLRQHHLMAGQGRRQGTFRVEPALRERVNFARLNLLDPVYPLDRDIDAVFLRNVLIYFEPAVQSEVIAHVTDHIAEGGFLLVGHSEAALVDHRALAMVAPSVYQKI